MKWNQNLTLTVVAALSAASASGVTFVVATKLLEEKYRKISEKEIQEAKAYYQEMYSRGVLEAEEPTELDEDDEELLQGVRRASQALDGAPDDVISRALDAMHDYSPETEEEEKDDRPPLPQRNIFVENRVPSSAVVDAILAERDESLPHIISKHEFYENEPGNEQKAFTFYDGDQVLVDDEDEFNPIMDTDKVAGDDNLLHFGYGSEDEFVLYIRNPTLDPPMDLHITKSPGKYGVEVMGFDDIEPHLEHSQKRFRLRDDD